MFICSFSAKVTCVFLVYKKQWRNSQKKILFELKKKNDGIFHVFDQVLKFQEYRCKSKVAIFAWRVTWNYAYSPFKFVIFRAGIIPAKDENDASPKISVFKSADLFQQTQDIPNISVSNQNSWEKNKTNLFCKLIWFSEKKNKKIFNGDPEKGRSESSRHFNLNLKDGTGEKLATITFSLQSVFLFLLSLVSVLLQGDLNTGSKAFLLLQMFNG